MDLNISVMYIGHREHFEGLLPAAVRFLSRPPREPVNAPEKQNHGNGKARIARGKPHHTKDNNVTGGDQQCGNEDDQNRTIHIVRLRRCFSPLGSTSPSLYRFPRRLHRLLWHPGANPSSSQSLRRKNTWPCSLLKDLRW